MEPARKQTAHPAESPEPPDDFETWSPEERAAWERFARMTPEERGQHLLAGLTDEERAAVLSDDEGIEATPEVIRYLETGEGPCPWPESS